jgi:hypothetical protein
MPSNFDYVGQEADRKHVVQANKSKQGPSSNREMKQNNWELMKKKQQAQLDLNMSVPTAEKGKKGKKKKWKKQKRTDKKVAQVTGNSDRTHHRISLDTFSQTNTKEEEDAFPHTEDTQESEDSDDSEDTNSDTDDEKTKLKQTVVFGNKTVYVGERKTFDYDGSKCDILRDEIGNVTGYVKQASVTIPGIVTLVYFVYIPRRISPIYLVLVVSGHCKSSALVEKASETMPGIVTGVCIVYTSRRISHACLLL